jgi:putative transposase
MEREVLGLAFGYSLVEIFRTEFLRTLVSRGLLGIKLVISDGHQWLMGVITGMLNTTWQKC